MTLRELLKEKRKPILKKWYELAVNTYPAQAAAFFRRNRDRFENPVGARLNEGLEGLLAILTGEEAPERLDHFVDLIVRVRAVQDFSPSEAVKVLLLLKRAVQEVLAKELGDPSLLREFLALCEEIDLMGLKAFDIYMSCRERLYHLKVEEWKSRMYMLLRKANLVFDTREGVLVETPNLMSSEVS